MSTTHEITNDDVARLTMRARPLWRINVLGSDHLVRLRTMIEQHLDFPRVVWRQVITSAYGKKAVWLTLDVQFTRSGHHVRAVVVDPPEPGFLRVLQAAAVQWGMPEVKPMRDRKISWYGRWHNHSYGLLPAAWH